jgi:hypothetical protein
VYKENSDNGAKEDKIKYKRKIKRNFKENYQRGSKTSSEIH